MTDAVQIINANLVAGEILFEENIEALSSSIEQEKMIIFRGVYSAEEMVEFRRAILGWAVETEEFPHEKSASKPGINFHRRDDELTPTTIPHIFHQFGFGNYDDLPAVLSMKLKAKHCELITLQNKLAKTRFLIDHPDFRLKAIRHPRGGGYLVPHIHPYLPQRVSLFLNLSEPGKDYYRGAVRFRMKRNWIDTHDVFTIGDVLAWRYDAVHETTPIDEMEPLSWSGDDGFWIFALEGADVHKHSEAHL